MLLVQDKEEIKEFARKPGRVSNVGRLRASRIDMFRKARPFPMRD